MASRLPADSPPVVTLEIVAEVPVLDPRASPHRSVPSSEPAATLRTPLGMRIQVVRDEGRGADAWDWPAVAEAPIAGVMSAGQTDGIVLGRASVPVIEGGAAVVFRCQILRGQTARDGRGHRRSEALHPTEEELIAVDLAGPTATSGASLTPARPPIPLRDGVGRMRPGVHTIALRLADDGEVTLSGVDE